MEVRTFRWDRYFTVALVLMLLALAAPVLENPAIRMLSNDFTAGGFSARMVGSLVVGVVNTSLGIAAFIVALVHYLRSRKASAAANGTVARPGTLPLVITISFGIVAILLSARLLWTLFWLVVVSNTTFSF